MIEKIQALLAKARDSACTEAEAEACMIKARRLMDEHGVSEAAAVAVDTDGVWHEVKYLEAWRKLLFNAAARYYGCSLMFRGSEKTFLVVGRESSRAVAISMMGWLDETVVRLAREWRRAEGASRSDQLNFERACGARIASRLREMTRAAVGSSEGAGGTSLVLRRELDEADEWLERRYTIRNTRAKTSFGGAGGEAGRAAGDSVGLGAQVRGTKGGVLRLGAA